MEEQIKRPGVGVAVIIEKRGRVFLGKRKKMNSHGVGTWCFPGGHIELWEELEDTCKREVMEEANMKIKNIRFAGITNDFFKKEGKHYITIFFKADYVSGTPRPNAELNPIGWFPWNKLPRPLFLCMKNYLKKLYKIE